MAHRFYPCLVVSFFGSVALGACVLPPSFDGYTEDTDAGTLAGGSGGTGGSAGIAGAGGIAGASAGGAAAGGTGGASGSSAGGTAGSATGGSAGAGSGGTGGTSTGPTFGEHCAMASGCGTGLVCSIQQGMPPTFGLGEALASYHVQGPTCGVACSLGTTVCQGPGGQEGVCVGATATTAGHCVPTCNVRGANVCAAETDCIHDWEDRGKGACSPRCLMDLDCTWLGLAVCRSDGLCDDVKTPSTPDDCAASGCECYPDPEASVGTCRIPCKNDGECPRHVASDQQMLCSHHPGIDSDGFGFCVVPCLTEGSTSECATLGPNAECISDGPTKACALPNP